VTRVAYATYIGRDDHEGRDDELEPVLMALRAHGLDAASAAWDDPAVAWDEYDAVLVRSTWDYATRRGQYLDWARAVAGRARLLNPLEVIERNTDKLYLRDVAAAGVAVVPTTWVRPGDMPLALPPGEVVVKPSVSANARDTTRTSDPLAAQASAAGIVASGRVAMVQPYLRQVEQEGELSLVYLGGRFSHAVRKTPALAAGDDTEVRAIEPAADMLEFAEAALRAVPGHPPARVRPRRRGPGQRPAAADGARADRAVPVPQLRRRRGRPPRRRRRRHRASRGVGGRVVS
jgi:hypothetical protein